MAFEIKPYPEWSWSQSRDGLFQECRRKYYYHYYQSHNGWLRDSEQPARVAYRLKQLTNLYLLLGDGVHQMAESAVKAIKNQKSLPTEEQSQTAIRNHLNQAYKDSKRRSQWELSPKKLTMLHELYYSGQLPETRVEQIKERMTTAVKQFLSCHSVKELQAVSGHPVEIVEVEELNTFDVAGNKVYVKLDVLYKRQDGTYVIVDWKTGLESDKNDKQLLLYALFLKNKYGISYDEIEIRVEYLLSGECKVVPIDLEALAEIKQQVIDSTEAMKKGLADPSANKPLPMNAFPAQPAPHKCGFCNYQELCDEKQLRR